MTWEVTDDAGVDQAWMKIGGASGWVTRWCGFVIEAVRIAGDARAGTYQATCDVPLDAVSDSYTAFIDAVDVFGTPTASLQVPFVVVGGVTDSAAPNVSDVSAPSSVSLAESLTVTWRTTDDSGVDYATLWLGLGGYSFADSTGRLFVTYDNAQLTGGTSQDGTYSQTFTFNPNALPGEYTVWVSTQDIYGNRNFFSTGVVVTATSP
jgi:hypothetical protein